MILSRRNIVISFIHLDECEITMYPKQHIKLYIDAAVCFIYVFSSWKFYSNRTILYAMIDLKYFGIII